MQPKSRRKRHSKDQIDPTPPGMYRKLWQHGWRQLCGHHVYEWSDVFKCCLACRRAVEGKAKQ